MYILEWLLYTSPWLTMILKIPQSEVLSPIVFPFTIRRIRNSTEPNSRYKRSKRWWHARLSVRLLVSGAGTGSTEFLGFAATRIRHQQTAIVIDQNVLDLLLGGFINIWIKRNCFIKLYSRNEWGKELTFLVVGNQRFGNGLSDGVNLGNMTTTLHLDPDVNSSKSIL